MTYAIPTDLTDALETLRRAHRCCVVAGGTDVYPAMRQGKRPAAFLDITRVAGLVGVDWHDRFIRIGAATTWTQIVQAPLPPAFDALKQAAREVGSVQIQNAGTIAGNLCNASPAADGVPPLLALDAYVELASTARGTRILSLQEFIQGVRETALAPDELVTAVRVPIPPNGMTSAFEKLGSRRYLVISICMMAANLRLDNAGCIAQARVAVGACSAVAQRLPALETELIGMRPEDVALTVENLTHLSPIDDVRGTRGFRLEAAAEQCTRAIHKAGSV